MSAEQEPFLRLVGLVLPQCRDALPRHGHGAPGGARLGWLGDDAGFPGSPGRVCAYTRECLPDLERFCSGQGKTDTECSHRFHRLVIIGTHGPEI
jgi:hypothetical protein